MFKIVVLLTGLLNGVLSTAPLTSNTTYPDLPTCKANLFTQPVLQDIGIYRNTLEESGYTDISILEYDCVPEELHG